MTKPEESRLEVLYAQLFPNGPDPVAIAETLSVAQMTRIAVYLKQHPGDLEDLMLRLGRNYGPYLVDLAPKVTAQAVVDAWCGADYPEVRLGVRRWRELFAAVGYTADAEPATPPDSMMLFRGAPHFRRRGMAWTSDRGKAEWFVKAGPHAHRMRDGRDQPSQLWTTTAGGSALLAFIHETGRKESEFVVDTRGLKVTAA